MTEQSPESSGQTPSPKRKIDPAFLTGSIVAIFAALTAVFLSIGNRTDTAPAPPSSPSSGDPIVSAQAAGQPPAPPAPGTATANGAVSFSDESLAFSSALPPGDGPLFETLRRETEAYLAKSKADAREAHDEAKREGFPPHQWTVELQWKTIAEAGDIVSLHGLLDEYTGGAHPMHYNDAIIARISTGERIGLQGVLRPGHFPSPAIVIGVCENLKVIKKAAIDSATLFDEPIVCAGPNANVDIDKAKFAFAPSDEPNKFGGLYVYFDPYVVGPYVEGSYTVTLQQDVFREDVRPEFKGLFGGKAPVIKR